LRLLLDECLPLSLARSLGDHGHDAVHALELELRGASDAVILTRAATLGRVIVTMDSDFHQLLRQSGDTQPSVIRIREDTVEIKPLANLIDTVTKRIEAELGHGAVASATFERIRIRRLPIGG